MERLANNFNKAQMELLHELSKDYMNLIVVIDPTNNFRTEIYIATEFRESNRESDYISLFGFRSITNIVSNNSSYINNINSFESIKTAIDTIPTPSSNKERKYSSQFIWVKL